jgi:predicted dehydrogenase
MHATLNRRRFIQASGLAALAAAANSNIFAENQPAVTLALVGCAHIHTPNYIRALRRHHRHIHVKSVWDHDAARAEKAAKELRSRTVPDVAAIWGDPEITAVVICSETNLHHDLILAAAKARKHMFAEKPMGTSGAESVEMARAIEQAGVLFTTGYFMRTDPRHLFLKSEIAKGRFGKITRVRASNCHEGSLAGWFDTDYRWMADPKIAGVGAFGDLGTHKLDILMWLLGDIDSVTAEIKTVTGRYGDCDESGEAMIQFKSGVTGTLAAGWVDVADPVQLLISGTEAHATIINKQLYYQNDKLGAHGRFPFLRLPPAPPEPMDQFLAAVSGDKNQPLVPPREAAARVMVMEAIYQGAHDHAWVKPASAT